MRRFGRVIAVAILGLAVSLTIAYLAINPRWAIRTLQVGTPGEDIQSVAWSPDGTRFLTQEGGRIIVMRALDAGVLLAADGYSPVWVDDRTIEFLNPVVSMRTQLMKLDLGGDFPSPLGGSFDIARLVGDHDGDLAARSLIGQVVTTVLDPTDGHVIDALPGLRGQTWAGSGTLISESDDPARQAQGVSAGSLVAWSANHGTWPIGAGMLDFRDRLTVSPSGEMIACLCGPASDQEVAPPLSVTIVPIDGSPAKALTPWNPANPQADPAVAWLDDRTLVFADQSGLHRLSVDGVVEKLPGLDPSELSTSGRVARIAVVGDAVAVLTLQGSGPTGVAHLTVIEADGSVALRRSFPSWNVPYFATDSHRPRALIVSDPAEHHQPPERVMLLGEGMPPEPSPLEPVPTLSPRPTPATVHSATTGGVD